MKSNENTYTSFDFMKIFGIKRGSWNNVKNKYNLDKFSKKVIEGKQTKFIYSQEAYEILKENYKRKVIEEIKENPKMFALVQENETLKATLDEYKRISSKFETMYNQEKKKNDNLIEENATIKATNMHYIEDNHRLEKEKYEIQEQSKKEQEELLQEIKRLNSRSFFARLFNK